ncbi:MAG: hypothetical protein M3410_15820 [Acidobacteriota bacterium]|nr:hypothetical protein [Acidobacteriota bacterium]
MAKQQKLRCTPQSRTNAIRKGEPFRWSVKVENREATTLHVSNRIHSLDVSPDGKVLQVSTARPLLAEGVTVSLMTVSTVPVAPNEAVDLDFTLPFPLRIVRFSEGRPRAEAEEWMPPADVEVRMTMAYGEQPFYPPADERRLNEALQKWTKTLPIEPLKVRVEKTYRPESPTDLDSSKGE